MMRDEGKAGGTGDWTQPGNELSVPARCSIVSKVRCSLESELSRLNRPPSGPRS
jgi:hypothetical protein